MSKSEQASSSAPPLQSSQSVPPSYSESVAQPLVMQQPLPIGFAVPHQMITPLGPTSINTNCPHCHAQIDTTVVSRPSIWAYMSSTVLALIGCWMGCCLIPCLIDDCMDKQHNCPGCNGDVGLFRRDIVIGGGRFSYRREGEPSQVQPS